MANEVTLRDLVPCIKRNQRDLELAAALWPYINDDCREVLCNHMAPEKAKQAINVWHEAISGGNIEIKERYSRNGEVCLLSL